MSVTELFVYSSHLVKHSDQTDNPYTERYVKYCSWFCNWQVYLVLQSFITSPQPVTWWTTPTLQTSSTWGSLCYHWADHKQTSSPRSWTHCKLDADIRLCPFNTTNISCYGSWSTDPDTILTYQFTFNSQWEVRWTLTTTQSSSSCQQTKPGVWASGRATNSSPTTTQWWSCAVCSDKTPRQTMTVKGGGTGAGGVLDRTQMLRSLSCQPPQSYFCSAASGDSYLLLHLYLHATATFIYQLVF